jgi:hypothetical protein
VWRTLLHTAIGAAISSRVLLGAAGTEAPDETRLRERLSVAAASLSFRNPWVKGQRAAAACCAPPKPAARRGSELARRFPPCQELFNTHGGTRCRHGSESTFSPRWMMARAGSCSGPGAAARFLRVNCAFNIMHGDERNGHSSQLTVLHTCTAGRNRHCESSDVDDCTAVRARTVVQLYSTFPAANLCLQECSCCERTNQQNFDSPPPARRAAGYGSE